MISLRTVSIITIINKGNKYYSENLLGASMGNTRKEVNQFMPQHLGPPVNAYFQRRRRSSICGVTHYVLTLVLRFLHGGHVKLVFNQQGRYTARLTHPGGDGGEGGSGLTSSSSRR